mgnify:CR=1 FL=1
MRLHYRQLYCYARGDPFFICKLQNSLVSKRKKTVQAMTTKLHEIQYWSESSFFHILEDNFKINYLTFSIDRMHFEILN